MGEVLNSILGGGGQAPIQAAMGLGDFLNQRAAEPMYGGISEAGAIPGSDQGQSPQEIVVQGDPFKPKKRSIWGVLGDAILLHSGHKGPFFADRKREQNLRRAMEGFAQGPVAAIQRVSRIPGMADEAWKMYGQHRDDERGDMAQQRLLGKDQFSIQQKAAGILGQVKEDGSNYGPVRALYNGIMRRNKIDFELPEEFDPELLGGLFSGAISPDKQQLNDYRQSRLEQMDRGLDIRETQGNRRLDQADTAERGRNERAANSEAGKDRRSKTGGGASLKGKAYKDSNGNVVEFDSENENKMKVTSPDGSVRFFRRGVDGKPVMVQRLTAEEYKKAVEEANKK
jgi:hypothetical protein